MALAFEDLQVLQTAESIADLVWREVSQWDIFARDVVGKQLARSTDSIGANIAEAFGRYHYGDRLQFLYYARGSLFETKYWLNRALVRELMPEEKTRTFTEQLTTVARQLNALATTTKKQKAKKTKISHSIRETEAEYFVDQPTSTLFNEEELNYLQSLPPNE